MKWFDGTAPRWVAVVATTFLAYATPAAAQVALPVTGVTASTHDGNGPANAVDGSLSTRWSASGDACCGCWCSRPRGEWRAPSDGNARVWLDELERNVPRS